MATSCEIEGSSDASVKNAVLADLTGILEASKIEKIILNGSLSYELFVKKYAEISIPYRKLSSTSPANPRFNKEEWERELDEVFRLD